MATAATINGIPSIFLTLTPPITSTGYSTYVSDAVAIAIAMVAELATLEPRTESEWLDDPETQAEFNAWIDAQDTPEAFDAYDAWVAEQERIAIMQEGEMSPEEEAHICEQYDAEAEAYANLGCAARHYIAGHDAVWQAGGSV